MAAEWAREKGAFWRFHDELFEARGHELDDMASLARSLGLDADDLRDAVTTHRYEQKVLGSRASGMAAGVTQTPTVYLDGRRLDLPDNSAEWLQFTLEDEEEWLRHPGKWDRD
jgi:predicted DsbA family dithiol-disulfide isomerase